MVIGLCLCAMFFLDISERDRNIILIGAFVVYLWGRYWDVIAQARKGGETFCPFDLTPFLSRLNPQIHALPLSKSSVSLGD